MDKKLKSRLFLLLIFTACAAPIALSFFTYYVWKPQKRMNYGELLQAEPISFAGMKTREGKPLPVEAWRGKWVMLLVDDPNCDRSCEARLYAMRQTEQAMIMKKEMLSVVWLLSAQGVPRPDLLAQYPLTHVVAAGDDLSPKLPQPSAGRIFVIDPKGMPTLRYPESPDAKRMMKDMGRLLDVKRM